jgi:hypothetical protein
MRRFLPLPGVALSVLVLLLALAATARAQPPFYYRRGAAPNLEGIWYNRANGGQCEITQQSPDGTALFINENGSPAEGTISRGRVYIPSWQDAYGQPLVGRIAGNRIIWPDGNFWYR